MTDSEAKSFRWHAKVLKFLNRLFLAWAASSVFVFLAVPMTYIFGTPKWLELPWSEFNDFVEGPEGRVYVSLGIYHVVLCYDRFGRFIASYRAPEIKHGVRLAGDEDGHLYYWAGEIVIKGTDWADIGHIDVPASGCNRWVLDENKKPVCWPAVKSWKPGVLFGPVDRVLSRPVTAGDVLFIGGGLRRSSFLCNDGSVLERQGDSLVRKSQDGRVLVRYGTPWYLLWANFPYPVFLAFPAVWVYGLFLWRPARRAPTADTSG